MTQESENNTRIRSTSVERNKADGFFVRQRAGMRSSRHSLFSPSQKSIRSRSASFLPPSNLATGTDTRPLGVNYNSSRSRINVPNVTNDLIESTDSYDDRRSVTFKPYAHEEPEQFQSKMRLSSIHDFGNHLDHNDGFDNHVSGISGTSHHTDFEPRKSGYGSRSFHRPSTMGYGQDFRATMASLGPACEPTVLDADCGIDASPTPSFGPMRTSFAPLRPSYDPLGASYGPYQHSYHPPQCPCTQRSPYQDREMGFSGNIIPFNNGPHFILQPAPCPQPKPDNGPRYSTFGNSSNYF